MVASHTQGCTHLHLAYTPRVVIHARREWSFSIWGGPSVFKLVCVGGVVVVCFWRGLFCRVAGGPRISEKIGGVCVCVCVQYV